MKSILELEKQYNISKEELQQFYSTHTNVEVATKLGVSKTQALRIIDAFELTKKIAYRPHLNLSAFIKGLDVKQFEIDYNNLTQAEVAAKYNLSIKQVIGIRDKLNINCRKVWNKLSDYDIDSKALADYYHNHTLQATKEAFNIGSITTLKALLKKYNIPIERRVDAYVCDLASKISKEELSTYYDTHTANETCEHFGSKTVLQLIKYYGLKKSKTHESFDNILARIDKEKFIQDYNNLNIYELFKKYNIAYTSYRKLVNYFKLGYKPGIFAFNNASMSTCEDSLYMWLRSLLPDSVEIIRHDRTQLSGKEIDIFVPQFNVGIEFNGDYWHSDLKCKKNRHYEKALLAQKASIHLIFIWEYEWHDAVQRNKLEQFFKILFNQVDNKLYARNCTVRQISNAEARPFNETTHLQGHRNAQVTYGLFYENNLVQLMSFSKTRYNKNLKNDEEWEIIRGCPGSNNVVIGGVSKLFKHFIDDYKPNKVFSYCDFNKFSGKSYETIGMTLVGYTGPDLKYKLYDGSVVNRNPKKYKYNNENCAYRMYGAGSKKYLWEK